MEENKKMVKQNKIGLGIRLKKDWDAVSVGVLLGALVIPHLPVISEIVTKANTLIASKVGK